MPVIAGANPPTIRYGRTPPRSALRPKAGEKRRIGSPNIANVRPTSSTPAPRLVRKRLQTTSYIPAAKLPPMLRRIADSNRRLSRLLGLAAAAAPVGDSGPDGWR